MVAQLETSHPVVGYDSLLAQNIVVRECDALVGYDSTLMYVHSHEGEVLSSGHVFNERF